MLSSLAGATNMEEVALFAKDRAIKSFVGRPLSATMIPRILRNLTKQQIQALHEFCLSNALLDIASNTNKEEFQTFDFDATAREKYGHQEGVEIGYIGDDMLAICYQYLFVRSDALNTIVYGTLRNGSTHSQNDFCGYLRMILSPFGSLWAIRIRADSGYYNEDAFDICQQHGVDFFIKAPMSLTRKAQALSPHLKWTHDLDDPAIMYATHQSYTAARTPIQEVFKRVPYDKSPDGYRFDCIVTNDLRAKPAAVYEFYNGRAKIENINSEMKGDLGLGRIVTKWFDVNDVITQAIILLYQMLSHFKRHCLDKADREKRAATLRDQLFQIPGEILRSARREWLRVYTSAYDFKAYARILARIEALKTPFVIIHSLSTA